MKKILLFLKGVLMGICDLIPGISGGTIAFITGIYAQLIESVKAFNLKIVYDFFRLIIRKNKKALADFKKDIKRINLGFLITLLLGILTALLLGSRVIKFLLENYFAYTLSFFIGLILISSKIIFDKIENHKLKNIFFGLIGLVCGILLSVLVPAEVTNPSSFYIFICGFFAVSAMFLPGISGAFILLILGLYEFMINVLHDITNNLTSLFTFVLGAILGAVVISRVISFLFRKDENKTLYFLLGLVLGALSTPIKRIYQTPGLTTIDIFIMLFYLILGAVIVIVVNYGLIKKK